MRWNSKKKNVRWCHKNPNIAKALIRNSHWRKLSMIMVWEHYCYASPKPEFFFIFFVYIFIHISAHMSPFGLEFSQMILHTETSKLIYNWSFLFVVLHKPTLLPSTFTGPGSSRVLDVLSYYLSLILKHSDNKLYKKHSRSKLLYLNTPAWIRHWKSNTQTWCVGNKFSTRNLLFQNLSIKATR